MNKLKDTWRRIVAALDTAGAWVALLPLRLILAYEFGSAGLRKLDASDSLYGDAPGWFANSADQFPFPINLFSVNFNWFMVTWVEILGGFALALGLFTRFWAFSLSIVTIVAIFGVHWPAEWHSLGELWQSYAITRKDGFGNFRIPLIFLVMLLPLVLIGAGKLSIDYLLARRFK